jgi:hypothetical protein
VTQLQAEGFVTVDDEPPRSVAGAVATAGVDAPRTA